MTTTQEYAPRWACSPGATIRDLMATKNVSFNHLAGICQLDSSDFEKLLHGNIRITDEIASSLAVNLGGSVSFWLRREQRYREAVAIVEADHWAESLPLKSMKKLAWLDAPKDWRARIDACLEFFGTDTLEEWKHSYANQLQGVHFRTSTTYPNQVSSVSAWLRAGEIASKREFDGGEFKPKILESLLDEFRSLTRIPDPKDFVPAMKLLGETCGVSCVIVQVPEGCAASGASRILKDGTALIQLSGRFLSDDQFWFSFFHEIGHLLLHKESALHVDGDSVAPEVSEHESEANTFSADVLWPLEDRPQISEKPSRRDVFRLAVEAGTSPGVIVGQLQAAGTLGHAEYNNLKRRYARDGETLVARK